MARGNFFVEASDSVTGSFAISKQILIEVINVVEMKMNLRLLWPELHIFFEINSQLPIEFRCLLSNRLTTLY